MRTTKAIGDEGEDLAAEYLVGQGYRIRDRNYRSLFGEVDIVAVDAGTIVFVEVKKKNTDRFGSPGEMITNNKIGKIKRTAEIYLREKGLESRAWRIDAVLIDGSRIELIRSITG